MDVSLSSFDHFDVCLDVRIVDYNIDEMMLVQFQCDLLQSAKLCFTSIQLHVKVDILQDAGEVSTNQLQLFCWHFAQCRASLNLGKFADDCPCFSVNFD